MPNVGTPILLKVYKVLIVSLIGLLLLLYFISLYTSVGNLPKIVTGVIGVLLLSVGIYQGLRGILYKRIYFYNEDEPDVYYTGLPAFLLGLGVLLLCIFIIVLALPDFLRLF